MSSLVTMTQDTERRHNDSSPLFIISAAFSERGEKKKDEFDTGEKSKEPTLPGVYFQMPKLERGFCEEKE